MPRLRTFIAVELERSVRSRCIALQEMLARTGGDVKWVEPDNLHVTLLFLGEVGDRDLPDLCATVAEACAGVDVFNVSVEGLGCFGNPRKPRTVWVGIGEGKDELIALHAALEAPLLELGCYRREERAFTPHVTLGRVKDDGQTDGLSQTLAKQADWSGGTFPVRQVVVMSSQLTPQGPIYAVVSTARLRKPNHER